METIQEKEKEISNLKEEIQNLNKKKNKKKIMLKNSTRIMVI